MEAGATGIATPTTILRVRRAVVTAVGALEGSTRAGAFAIDARLARLTSGLAIAAEPGVLCRVNAEVSRRRHGIVNAVHCRCKRGCCSANTLPCLTFEFVRGAGVSAFTTVRDHATRTIVHQVKAGTAAICGAMVFATLDTLTLFAVLIGAAFVTAVAAVVLIRKPIKTRIVRATDNISGGTTAFSIDATLERTDRAGSRASAAVHQIRH